MFKQKDKLLQPGKAVQWINGDRISKEALEEARGFLFVGPSGVGKTTLLNGMANYLLGVEYFDDRLYKVAHSEPAIPAVPGEKEQCGGGEGATSTISAYCITERLAAKPKWDQCRDPVNCVLIDTPGLGKSEE